MSGSFWSRGFARWKERRRWDSIHQWQVQWDSAEIRVVASFKDGRAEIEWSKAWAEVRKVVAFKRDQHIYDCICLGLQDASGSWHGLDEEMVGWDAFMAALPANLPGCVPWESAWKDVALPPFKENGTILFERSAVGF